MHTEAVNIRDLSDAELDRVSGGLTDNQKLGVAIVVGGPIVWLGFGLGVALAMANGNTDNRT